MKPSLLFRDAGLVSCLNYQADLSFEMVVSGDRACWREVICYSTLVQLQPDIFPGAETLEQMRLKVPPSSLRSLGWVSVSPAGSQTLLINRFMKHKKTSSWVSPALSLARLRKHCEMYILKGTLKINIYESIRMALRTLTVVHPGTERLRLEFSS